jgi:hypothetical protein
MLLGGGAINTSAIAVTSCNKKRAAVEGVFSAVHAEAIYIYIYKTRNICHYNQAYRSRRLM